MTFNVKFKTGSLNLGIESLTDNVEERGYFYFYEKAEIGITHLNEARKSIKVLYPNWQPAAEDIVFGLKNEFEKTLTISEQDAMVSGLFQNRSLIEIEIENPTNEDLLSSASDLFEIEIIPIVDENNNIVSAEIVYNFDWVCILDVWFRNGMDKKMTLDMFR